VVYPAAGEPSEGEGSPLAGRRPQTRRDRGGRGERAASEAKAERVRVRATQTNAEATPVAEADGLSPSITGTDPKGELGDLLKTDHRFNKFSPP